MRPKGVVLSLGFSIKSAYPSRLDPITLTISKMCAPLNVSAHNLTTAQANCRSLALSLVAISICPDPGLGPESDGSTGTANSVSSSMRRTVSSKFFSSEEAGGSDGPIEPRVRSHLAKRIAHSKLQTVDYMSLLAFYSVQSSHFKVGVSTYGNAVCSIRTTLFLPHT